MIKPIHEKVLEIIQSYVQDGESFNLEHVVLFYTKIYGSSISMEQALQSLQRLRELGYSITLNRAHKKPVWFTFRSPKQEEQTEKKIFPNTPQIEQAKKLLGIFQNEFPTIDEIKKAFNQTVKDSADGWGGYTADMDDVVKAKELLLSYAS